MHANYKAYIESLLSYSHPAAVSHLQSSAFFLDTESKFEEFSRYVAPVQGVAAAAGVNAVAAVAEVKGNKAFEKRRRMFELSKSVQLMTPIHCDFMQSDKYLPPGVKLSLRFNRAPDSFILMSTNTGARYKVIIEEIKLHLRHVRVNPSIVTNHMDQFKHSPMIYLINKTVIKTFAFPSGLPAINVANMFTGVLPKTVIVMLVKASAFHGTYNSNPYYFQHFGMNHGYITVNSEQVPSDAYQPDWDKGHYIREYRELFDNVGISHNDMGNLITPELFSGGAFMMAFDLTPDRCNGRHWHPRQSGKIDLDLKFKAPLTEPINVLAFATYDALMKLDKYNRVITDITL